MATLDIDAQLLVDHPTDGPIPLEVNDDDELRVHDATVAEALTTLSADVNDVAAATSSGAATVAAAVAAQAVSAAELTQRMLAKTPAVGWRLWFDTANAAHLYIAEAEAGTDADTATFRGIRITLDTAGNPVGPVEVAVDFSWDDRTAAGWAA